MFKSPDAGYRRPALRRATLGLVYIPLNQIEMMRVCFALSVMALSIKSTSIILSNSSWICVTFTKSIHPSIHIQLKNVLSLHAVLFCLCYDLG